MGRQIHHLLSETDEARLIDYLRAKFPVVVMDSAYRSSWDRSTVHKTAEADRWIIGDERTLPILTDSAAQLTEGRGWEIRSTAFSCVEWTRRGLPHGRLYLNTTPDPIGEAISAASGGTVERIYNRACRWIRASCTNCETSGSGVWVSRERLDEHRQAQEEADRRRRARPRDPRDQRFYALHRKPAAALTPKDRATLLQYCDAMISYLGDHEAAESWREYRGTLLGSPRS